MNLPHADNAHIAENKIKDYLLNLKHSGGGENKARFFRNFGFILKNSSEFEIALLEIARNNQVSRIVPTLFGTKYIIEGILRTPDHHHSVDD
jgi:hypothetical protein